ncbi:hypothetical protein S83_008295 [Arachis hypogaea]
MSFSSPSSQTRTYWSMFSSSWTIVTFVLVMSMMTTTCISAETRETSFIEHCIRMKIISPPPVAKRYQRMVDFGHIVCRDQFRIVWFSIRSTGKLPKHYLEALCNIYNDDQKKVNGYVKDNFVGSDPQKLIGGETCATIREYKKKLLKAPPPSLKKL